eukprot:TRINITY_DN89699_c0_g1_i1.p1 TRINITY_DN89699_c0_g1~~TRINITY_DN89699_c0_g1_i1.p1  ORF type:complete len:364 (+),score=99.68 TRINITY_DN89699_c0_g1_i1:31-1092(+)
MAMMPMMDMMPLSPDLKPMVLGIMNEKYPDALSMYVRFYGKKNHCREAKLIDVTERGFSVSYQNEAGEPSVCKFFFLAAPAETEITCSTVGAARRAFVEMARHAAAQLGESIELPPPSAPSDEAGSPDGNQMEALAMMMAMMKGKGKGHDDEGLSSGDPLAGLLAAMLKGKGKGAGAEAPASSPPGASTGNIRTLHDSSSSAADPMAEMMAQLMAAKGKGKAAGKAAPVDPWANLGAGNRLDGGSSSSTAAAQPASEDSAELAAQVRPVDPALPTITIKVRLPNRTTVTVTFNSSHTVAQVRAYLQVNHAEAFSGPFVLMDVGGFPPKKLADPEQTLDEAGVKSGASLDCRKT